MFSNKKRCIYRASPAAEVICQLRFPEILAVTAADPVEFQEAIREAFPVFVRKQEMPMPKLSGTTIQKGTPVTNFQFSSADGVWRVNLTNKFISLACTRYSCWETFARHLDQPLAAFIRIYKPAYFERVGLRYVNFLSRQRLGLEGIPFRELIAPAYLGPLALEDVAEASASRCTVDCDIALRGGCRAKIHAGPGLVQRNGIADKEVKFIFDQDLYMTGQLQLNLAAGALHTLHAQAFSLFRGAITQRLHEAMGPEEE